MDHGFYDMIDFNIGKNVELFGRVFRIVNCDKFTRNFLNRMGIFVGDPLSYPTDPFRAEEEKVRLVILNGLFLVNTLFFINFNVRNWANFFLCRKKWASWERNPGKLRLRSEDTWSSTRKFSDFTVTGMTGTNFDHVII